MPRGSVQLGRLDQGRLLETASQGASRRYSVVDAGSIQSEGERITLLTRVSGTTQVNWYQKGKTNLDFTEARDSEWQWHQLGHMQVCTLLQTDNHASTPPLKFLHAGCPSCHPTNSVKALKAH